MTAWDPQTPRSLASLLAVELIQAHGPEAGDHVEGSADGAGTPVLDVPLARWTTAAAHVRDAWGLDYFDWLSAVDAPDDDPAGVRIVAHLAASHAPARRLLLRTAVPDGTEIPSLTSLWPGAAWHERETFEMFGVVFADFTDLSGLGLRPLLLPEGFEGTPLRKSFVLASRVSKAWPGSKEPGESDAPPAAAPAPGARAPRKKASAPGVPDPAVWGPRDV